MRDFRILTFSALVALAEYCHAQNLKPFEATSMIDSYCYAGSRKDDKAIGGYGPSDNAPRKVTGKTPGRDGQIALIAMPGESAPFMEQYRGFRLLLINRTAAEAAFAACDSRLNLVCEARDQNGGWKAIEILPSSFCGNSYHSVYLPAGHYWEFHAPAYSGSIKARLRYHLQGKQPIYSNEFDGNINAAQFKRPAPAK